MSINYFSNYPITTYKKETSLVLPSGNKSDIDVSQVDLYLKYKIKNEVLNNTSLFYPYIWKDYDTPWTLAKKYYGSEKYHWVIFYSNNFFDLAGDFPLTGDSLDRFLVKKYKPEVIDYSYGASLSAYNADTDDGRLQSTQLYMQITIHHYEDSNGYIVDEDTYNLLNAEISGYGQSPYGDYYGDSIENTGSVNSGKIVYVYDYEIDINEAKRNIQVLDNEYIVYLMKDFLTSFTAIKAERAVNAIR